MKISDYTLPELDFLASQCNFTDDEAELFLLRAKDKTLEDCAERLNISVSTVKRLNKRVKTKIGRIYH